MPTKPAAKPLSPKETEILRYVLQEMSSAEIAEKLELSKRTIDTHRKNIIKKTNVIRIELKVTIIV